MFSNLNIAQKGMILVLVPVIFELCFVVGLALYLLSAEKHFDELRHSKEVIISLQQKEILISKVIILVATGGQEDIDEKWKTLLQLKKKILASGPMVNPGSVPELHDLIEQELALQGEAERLTEFALKEFGDSSLTKRERQMAFHRFREKNRAFFFQTVMNGAPLGREILELETRVNKAVPEEIRNVQTVLISIVMVGLLVSSLISIFLARAFANDFVLRLQKIADHARLVAAFKPIPETVKGTDELATVDGILHDASSKLNYAHAKSAAIVDNAASVICSLDERLRFADVNASATRFWQYSSDELLGKSVLSLLRADTVGATTAGFESVATTAGQGEVENIVRSKSKTDMNCLWTVNWLALKHRFYCVVHDVTELRAMERLKQYVISIVGHDLRAPLTAVNLNLGLISDGKRGEVSEAVLSEINKSEKSLSRLMQLVNDLLDLEKLSVGKSNLDRSCVSAADICNDAKESVEALAVQSRVAMKGPIGDAAVFADSQRLIQVMVNLLSNAIKFSPPGSVINIAIVKKGDMIELQVKDEGPGIPTDEQSLIFDKFHQVRSTAGVVNANIKSTGLGLAIVKEIVTAHEGECGVESEPDKGSTFWLRIPEFLDPLEDEI